MTFGVPFPWARNFLIIKQPYSLSPFLDHFLTIPPPFFIIFLHLILYKLFSFSQAAEIPPPPNIWSMGRGVTFPRVRKVRIFKPLQVQFLGHFLRFFPFFLYILPHLLSFILPQQPLPPHLPYNGTKGRVVPLH